MAMAYTIGHEVIPILCPNAEALSRSCVIAKQREVMNQDNFKMHWWMIKEADHSQVDRPHMISDSNLLSPVWWYTLICYTSYFFLVCLSRY